MPTEPRHAGQSRTSQCSQDTSHGRFLLIARDSREEPGSYCCVEIGGEAVALPQRISEGVAGCPTW